MRKPFDLEKYHPLFPRKEILAEYEKVKFGYDKTVHDRAYERWYALVKGRPVEQEVTQIYRKKLPDGQEFLIYNVNLYGSDWKGNELDFDAVFGKYDLPIFRLERNPETQEVSSTQVTSHKTIYDIPFSLKKLEELLEMSVEGIALAVYSPGGRRYGGLSVEDYRNGGIQDLIMCADKGKSLETVLAEKGQFTYEKREISSKKKVEQEAKAI